MNRPIPWLLAAIVVSVALSVLSARAAQRMPFEPLAFTHVTVVDTLRAVARPDQTVVVTAGRITAVGMTAAVNVPEHAFIVDATGKFLIPGLWDMHVHLFNQISRRPPNTWYFPLFVLNGVTSIREMWTKPDNMPQVREWRRLQLNGTLLAPRIAAVGCIVDGPAAGETNPAAALLGPTADVVSTPAQARQFVRKVKEAGIDFVKTYSSLSRDAYFAIASEAKKQGIPFAGHVPSAVGAAEASAAGQRSMEHLDQILESSSSRSDELFQVPGSEWSDKYDQVTLDTFDEDKFRSVVAVLAKNQSWQVPTLVRKRVHALRGEPVLTGDSRLRYVPADEVASWSRYFPAGQRGPELVRHRLWQKQLAVVGLMHQAGVPFMTGTDVGGDYIFPGFSLHDELAWLVEAGFTPGQALKTATYNPAKFLGLLDRFGTVEQGKLADLVLLDANPLDNVRNTQNIQAVVLNGRYFDRRVLDKLLADAAAYAKIH
jgi:imidazolonepropionase-like amidohydrolase